MKSRINARGGAGTVASIGVAVSAANELAGRPKRRNKASSARPPKALAIRP
jgi:hypothetical protein